MEQIGYGKHIADTVRNMPYDMPIQTEDIVLRLAEVFFLPYEQARSITNVKLKRMADKGDIERLHKGVYCQVKQTVFGRTTPSAEEVLKNTLIKQNGVRIGYESGAFLLNKLGLTSLIPRDIEITTNRYAAKLPDDCHIILRKPSVYVTDDNWKYLQFIDMVIELSHAHCDVENPEQLLARYAEKQKLDFLTLIFTARRHYPAKVLSPLIDVLIKVRHELAS